MEKNIEVEKSIEALLVEPGKAPRKITVRNSKEGVAEVLGEGTLEMMGVHHQRGAVATFLSVVMICREADLDDTERNPSRTGGLPGIALLCCADGNDLVSLPPALQEKFLKAYAESGNQMIMDGNFVAENPDALKKPKGGKRGAAK